MAYPRVLLQVTTSMDHPQSILMTDRIFAPTDASLALAADCLRAGGLVGLPTETVYGLAALASRDDAIARVFAAKERPLFDPLIAHLAWSRRDPLQQLADSGLVDLGGWGAAARERVARLAAAWPGPLTLVLPRTDRVPDLATAGLPTVAVRAPSHPVAAALLARTGPLVAPSANRFGRISPTAAADVVAELGDRVDLVLDGGRCTVGVESSIVGVSPDGSLTLLRPGGLPREAIAAWAGGSVDLPARGATPSAPGSLPSHYAPRTPLQVLGPDAPLPAGRVGLLRMRPGPPRGAVAEQVLSETGDLSEIARGLFAALRALDALGLDQIVAEPSPSALGLGHAIADRLARAAHRD